jgi:thiamine biosynthesis lipoprotein
MATSGNYRNFYYEGAQKRSHTIDPRTGYPVQHSLLSATVTASTCMRADALATACMVLGDTAAISLINRIPDAECYLIVAAQDTLITRTSNHWTLTE